MKYELSLQWHGSFCSGGSFFQGELLHSDGTRLNGLDCPVLSASAKHLPDDHKTTKELIASALNLVLKTRATVPGFPACISAACLREGSARSPTVVSGSFKRQALRHVSCFAEYPGSAPRWSPFSMAGENHLPSSGDISDCYTYPSGRRHEELFAPYNALANLPNQDTWRVGDTGKCGILTSSFSLGRSLLAESQTSENRTATVLAAGVAGRVIKLQRLQRRRRSLNKPLSDRSRRFGKNVSAFFAGATGSLWLKQHCKSCARKRRKNTKLWQLDGQRQKLRYICFGSPPQPPFAVSR